MKALKIQQSLMTAKGGGWGRKNSDEFPVSAVEKLEVDLRGFVWWTAYVRGSKEEICLGRNRTPEELEDLARWAKRRKLVLPPELTSLKLSERDKEWGHIT